MQDKLIELQSKLSFQEQSLSELNEALVSQQQQIDRLRLHLQILQDRLQGLEEEEPLQEGQEKPPHY
jgi:SlyX protein